MSRARALPLAGGVLTLVAIAMTDARAGGFAIREQSVVGQGASFAGVAAGGVLSAMFWNPATVTQQPGMNVEIGVSAIVPKSSQSGVSSLGLTGLADNTGNSVLVPSSYFSWQLNDRFWIAVGVNAPFGLSVSFPKVWAGSTYAQNSALQAHNFNPIVALKVADGLSVAVGLQAQYMDISYENFQAAAAANLKLTGTGWAWGWTAGVTFTPFPQTQIGLGYRSAIDQELDGLLSSGLGVTTNGPITAILPLPDTVTVGLRQGIGDRFTLLAGFEWSNWSRIGTVPILRSTGGPALGATGSPITLPFQYEDGYFYSVGLEYCATPGLTLRAGFAYEESPVVDRVRTPRLPDNDRFWYSVGLTYKPPLLPGVLFDLAYSFIDVTDTPLTATAASGNPWFSTGAGIYTGISSSHISILSFGFRYRWDEPAVKRSAAFAK